MNKRSAMIVSAGLIVALVAGAYALATGNHEPNNFGLSSGYA